MIEIVSVRLFAIHPVNQGFALVIGLEAEGQISVPVPLHLCREPSLDSEDCGLHRIDHLGAEGTVLRSEVDHLYGARVLGRHRHGFAGGEQGILPRMDDPVMGYLLPNLLRSGGMGEYRSQEKDDNREYHRWLSLIEEA